METLAEMDAWIEANGEDAFDLAMRPGGAFNNRHRELGYLVRQRAASREEAQRHQAAVDREERAVRAAERAATASERSAVAAEDSALSARKAVRWAWAAALVAMATLAVAGVPAWFGP